MPTKLLRSLGRGLASAAPALLTGNWVSAGVLFTSSTLYNLTRKEQEEQRAPGQFFSRFLDTDTYEQYAYGYLQCPVTMKWFNSRVPVQPFPDKWQIKVGRPDPGPSVLDNTPDQMLDTILWLSNGQMDKLVSLVIDGVAVNLTQPVSDSSYVPDTLNKFRDRIIVDPYFAVRRGPTELEDNYEDKSPSWDDDLDHLPNESYLHARFLMGRQRHWREFGFPTDIRAVCQGVRVYDLSKYPRHEDMPKVWSANAVACHYDACRRILKMDDDQINMQSVLDAYNYCEGAVENDVRLYTSPTSGPISEGQTAGTDFSNIPTQSYLYSFSGIVSTEDVNLDRFHDQFTTAYNGFIYPDGGKLSMWVGRYKDPVSVSMHITDEDWIGQPRRTSQTQTRDQFNQLTLRWQSQQANFREKKVTLQDDDAVARNDDKVLPYNSEVLISHTSDDTEVTRFGNNMLVKSRTFDRLEGYIGGLIKHKIGDTLYVSSTSLRTDMAVYLLKEKRFDREENRTYVLLEFHSPNQYLASSILPELNRRTFERPTEVVAKAIEPSLEILYCRYRLSALPSTSFPDNDWRYLEGGTAGGVNYSPVLPDYTPTEPYRFFVARYVKDGIPYNNDRWDTPTLIDFRGEVAFPIETSFNFNNNSGPDTIANLPTWRWVTAAGHYHVNDIGGEYNRVVHNLPTARGQVIPRDEFLDVFENYLGVPPFDRMRTYFNATDSVMRSMSGYFLDIFKRTVLSKPDAEALRLLKGFGYQRKGVVWLGANDTLIRIRFSDRYWAIYKVKAFSQGFHTKDFVYSATDEAGYLRNMRALEAGDFTHFGFRFFRIAYKFEERPVYTGTNSIAIDIFGSRNLSSGVASAAAGADGQGKEFLFTSSMTPQITDRTKLPRDDNPYDLGTNQNGQLWTDQANPPSNFFPYVLIISRDVPGSPARGTVPDLTPGSGWSRWGTPTLFAELGRDGLWLEYAYFQHATPALPVRPTPSNMYVGTTLATLSQRNATGFLPNTRQSATVAGDQNQYGQWLDEQPSVRDDKPFTSLISRMRLPGHTQTYTDWSEVKALPSALERTQVFYLVLPRQKYHFRRRLTDNEVVQISPLGPDTRASDANTRDLTASERRIYIRGRTFIRTGFGRAPIANFRIVEWMLNDFPDEFANDEDVEIWRCQRTRQADGTWGGISRVIRMGSTADAFPDDWATGKFLTENASGEQVYDFPYPDTGNLDASKNYVLTVPAGATTPVWAEPAGTEAPTPAPTTTIPGVPSNVQITNIGTRSVTVSWTAPTTGSPVTSYLVQYSPGGLSHPQQNVATDDGRAPAPTTVDIVDLSMNTSYVFYVTARNSAGPSTTYASSASIKTLNVRTLSKPGVPTFTLSDATTGTPTDRTASSFKVSITAGTGDAPDLGYVIEYSTFPSFSASLFATASESESEKTLENLSANTAYYVRVRARNSAGRSSNSPSQTITTPQVSTAVSAPVLSVENITTSTCVLRWTAGNGLTGAYDVYATGRRGARTTFGTALTTGLRATTYTFSGWPDETYRRFRVDGRTAGGTIYQSNVELVTFSSASTSRSVPPLPKPAAPAGTLRGSSADSTEIVIPEEAQDVERRIVRITRRDV